MNSAKRLLMVAGAFALATLTFTLANPKAVHAFASALVTVVNTQSDPVLNQDVNNGPRQAVQLFFFQEGPSGSFISGNLQTNNGGDYTVPTGKRLVIESVTAQFIVPSGTKPVVSFINTQASDGIYSQLLPPATFLGAFSNGDYYQMANNLKAYSDANSVLQINFSRTGGVAFSSVSITVNGYLVDCGNGGCPAQP